MPSGPVSQSTPLSLSAGHDHLDRVSFGTFSLPANALLGRCTCPHLHPRTPPTHRGRRDSLAGRRATLAFPAETHLHAAHHNGTSPGFDRSQRYPAPHTISPPLQTFIQRGLSDATLTLSWQCPNAIAIALFQVLPRMRNDWRLSSGRAFVQSDSQPHLGSSSCVRNTYPR